MEAREVVERYLTGKLTPDEEREFEEAYLADPQLLDQLMLAENLRQGLRLHEERAQHDELRERNVSGELREPDTGGELHGPAVGRKLHEANARGEHDGMRRVGTGRHRRGPSTLLAAFRSPRYATAASAMLALSVVLSGVLYRENRDLRASLAQAPESAVVTRLMPLVTVRGDGVNTIATPGAQEWVVFLVDAGYTEYDIYRAVVSRREAASSEPVRELEFLVPTYDGMLPVGLPGSLLAPGDFEIVIEGRMRAWPSGRASDRIGTTPLRIVPAQ